MKENERERDELEEIGAHFFIPKRRGFVFSHLKILGKERMVGVKNFYFNPYFCPRRLIIGKGGVPLELLLVSI